METITASNITGFDSTTAGTKTLTITAGGKTATYTVNVEAVTLSSIAIKTPATKLSYYVGEPLDIAGLTVEGTYNNGTKKIETITASNITGFDSTTAGTKTLTITAGGKTATYTVNVEAVTSSVISTSVVLVGEGLIIILSSC